MDLSPVIKVNDLSFSYNGHQVLKNVDLTIESGEFLSIIGPNGGGKTTLIKLMLGLLKPSKGIIKVMGKSPLEAAIDVGYVPQDIHFNKGFPISVKDVVLMGRIRGGGGWKPFSKKDRMLVQETLEQVDMWEHRKSKIGQLSGGQRQRVFVARALATDPQILFLDEPTASVDTNGQTEFYELLKKLNESITILVVSHDFNVISSFVKSVACVNQQLFFHDEPEITGDMLEFAYHCPVELVAHGVPHRVLHVHKEGEDD